MIFGVTGGRDKRISSKGYEALDKIYDMFDINYVISGHCPTKNNVDLDFEQWAKSKRLDVKLYEAKFYINGVLDKKAGPERNKLMAFHLSNWMGVLIVFKGGKGTANMVEECKSRYIPVIDLSGDEYVETI